ncbi:hypothetical protein DWB77_02712 [Streptomyces hundungensis]|uniref:Uncharacterized protein n=1 Tax=Streptomyces hundungensis TaxID=1077946 RepID=A0A387H9R4_9ACTN|nr:hypothetical protein DWB77_02712 [Streptomyces hundungensis]
MAPKGRARRYRREVDDQNRPVAETIVCSHCGTPAPGEGPPPTWTYSVENGTGRYYCDDCARANIRAIEGRLDATWW